MKNYKPTRFISEAIEAHYDKPPLFEKSPDCPDGFVWAGETFRIIALLREWRDYTRKGRMAHNMGPVNLRKAARRGSVGVGRFHFRVKVADGRIFDLYYDRAVESADQRKGSWTLHQELGETRE